MPKLNDLTGKRFGRLEVLGRATNDKSGNRMWLCRCDCGEETTVYGVHISRGKSLSCGCLQREETGKRARTHGLRKSRTYRIWAGMKYRCQSPDCASYRNYGGRGITVCDEWQSFESFYSDMGKAPAGLTLERINNEAGYSKSNCRWATRKEQCNNTRKNKTITHDGLTLTQTQWAERQDINLWTLRKRFDLGWSNHDALTIPPGLVRPSMQRPTRRNRRINRMKFPNGQTKARLTARASLPRLESRSGT
jgi:hypothetical protein